MANAGIDSERRRRVRRMTIGLALVALAFYIGFILLAVQRSCAIITRRTGRHGRIARSR
jgi:uncharacterized membrane protein (DUF485 family)